MSRRTAPPGHRRAPDRGASREALLAALRPDAGAFAARVEADAERLDWSWMLERAAAHKVTGLLAHRLGESGARGVPDELRGRLRSAREAAFLRAFCARETLRAVAEAFGAAGVPFLLLKGPFLAERVYPGAEVRTPSDLDLLVAPERVAEAGRALRSAGYRAAAGGPAGGTSRKEVLYAPPDGAYLPIDLHWQLADPGAIRHPASLARHLRRETVCGTGVEVLDREAMLVHLALHAVLDSPAHLSLIHFADVAWYVARFGSECDGARVRAIAAEWRSARYLAGALRVVGEVVGAEVPAHLRPLPPAGALRAAAFRRASSALVDAPRPPGRRRGGGWGGLRWLLWFAALGTPVGYAARLVWGEIAPRLPTALLDRLRRSAPFRRISRAANRRAAAEAGEGSGG